MRQILPAQVMKIIGENEPDKQSCIFRLCCIVMLASMLSPLSECQRQGVSTHIFAYMMNNRPFVFSMPTSDPFRAYDIQDGNSKRH